MPATPRWLLAIPDAIRQLEALDREVLTRATSSSSSASREPGRRRSCRPSGPSSPATSERSREHSSCASSGRHRTRAAFRGEATRRDRVVTAIRQARLTGIRVAVPSEAREARLSGLPAGVSVEPGRIEVRFSGAQDAVGRLFALAQALTHDYERFEALVEEGEAAGGGGAVRE